MKQRRFISMTMVLMAVGLLFTAACAKQTVDSAPVPGMTMGKGAEDVAAARDQELARQKALAEEAQIKAEALAAARLRDAEAARLRDAEAAQKRALANKFQRQDILFGHDCSDLSPRFKTVLKEKAFWIKENPMVNILIEGHCDSRGTAAYNLAIGERRALCIKKHLIDLGIAEYRLATISFGKERPIDPADNETSWSRNRRAHFAIKNE
ncbi:MAG: OmpA family protein [Desulfobacterium sp.]|nr:OmpA family protein [Desulfobacterium sp.]